MGEFLSKFFVDVNAIPETFAGLVQVLFLGGAYGCILFNASNLISEGSELLLLVPSLAGVVGSVVLPVLGAVPDGAIVLFSGLGPDAQEQLQVGVGALAGSTIMLLTIPWALSIVGGRVSIKNGEATYTKPRGFRGIFRKLEPPGHMSLTEAGVQPKNSIAIGARIMLLTACAYLTIQIPAFLLSGESHGAQSRGEKWWSFFGMLLSIVLFVAYLLYQFRKASEEADEVLEDRTTEIRKKALRDGIVNLRGLMGDLYSMQKAQSSSNFRAEGEQARGVVSRRPTQPLIANLPDKTKQQMRELLRPFFHELDADKTGNLDHEEVKFLFRLLNENPTHAELEGFMSEADTDGSGKIEFEEFCAAMLTYVHRRPSQFVSRYSDEGSPEGEDVEEESVPEDLAELSPELQQYRIKLRALHMMCLGTALVLIFSDPMVDVFASLGKRSGIPGFYISFVLAPLASNASELIASYNYALKKTKKTITISLAALEGAACMNNTFCLAIFLALIFFRGLYWNFSAETISILMVEVVMAGFAMKKIMTVMDALLISALYPLSIAFVWILQKVLHMT